MSLKKARAGLDPISDRGKAGVRRFLKRALSRWERRTKRTGRRMYFGFSSLLFLACHSPAPQPVPTHDADGAPLTSVEAACANLAALGCREGLDVHCVATLGHVIDAGLEAFDPTCMATATSKASMRACPLMHESCP